MPRHALAFLLSVAAAAAVAADNPETTVERSQSRARAVLDRAVEANGGAEALQAVKVVRLRLEGPTMPRLQMPTAQPPFEGGRLEETLLVDLESNRLRLDQVTDGAGFAGRNTIVIAGGQGTNYDHRARTATPIPAAQASQQQFIQYYRRLPNLLLQQALNAPNTLRHVGEGDFDGRRHEVITFTMPDAQQVALYVDAATALISKYELIYVDSLTGVEASEIIFRDYGKSGAYQLPRKFINRQAGEQTTDFSLSAEINPAITDASFAVEAPGYARVAAFPTTQPQAVDAIGTDVQLIRNVAGQGYNSLAVGFPDHVVVVEAPSSSGGADAVIARVKELFPGRPIRYVAVTHHHGDHIGGIRSFIAEGATVVTTAANRPVIEAMAAAGHNDRLGRNPRKPEFLLIERGKRVLEAGGQRLELIDVGPNPHAREMIVAWLPKDGILFQGDLFFVPPNDAPFGPPQASTASFAQKVRELGLPVKKVAGVHGGVATAEQFEQATAAEH